MSDLRCTTVERCDPILRVEDVSAAVRYYVDVLGFERAPWGDDHFTSVSRDDATIYLVSGEQGNPGAWVWLGVADARALHDEVAARGARIVQGLTEYPWALEFRVEDLDGNVLRVGSDPGDARA